MKEGCRNGASLSGERGGTAPLLESPKGMLSKALEMGVCLHRVPVLENMEGRSFLRAFEGRDKFLYLGKFL